MNIVFLYYTDGYPVKFSAANTKAEFVAEGLMQSEVKVHLINKSYGPNNVAPEYVDNKGIIVHSIKNTNGKIVSSIKNLFKTFAILRKVKQREDNYLLIGCGNTFLFAPLLLASKLIGYKSAFILEEWEPSIPYPFIYKVNALIHGHLFGYLFDYILPISEFLTDKARKFGKPMLKFPICSDFNFNVSTIERTKSTDYFLYCASAGYQRAIYFVLDAYEIFNKAHTESSLHLVLNGSKSQLDEIKDVVAKRKLQNVEIKTSLPYNELQDEYRYALGLLIPLFPDRIADVARFSQKISEYLTSKRPVVSSKVGEIPYYFHNHKDMCIDATNTVEGYASEMEYLWNNRKEADSIGNNGFELGKSLFDKTIIAKQLIDFFRK